MDAKHEIFVCVLGLQNMCSRDMDVNLGYLTCIVALVDLHCCLGCVSTLGRMTHRYCAAHSTTSKRAQRHISRHAGMWSTRLLVCCCRCGSNDLVLIGPAPTRRDLASCILWQERNGVYCDCVYFVKLHLKEALQYIKHHCKW